MTGMKVLRYAAFSGAAWGLFLETFQLTLYPQWLGISLIDEFVRISALSHVAYGVSLGMLVRWGLRKRQQSLMSRYRGSDRTES